MIAEKQLDAKLFRVSVAPWVLACGEPGTLGGFHHLWRIKGNSSLRRRPVHAYLILSELHSPAQSIKKDGEIDALGIHKLQNISNLVEEGPIQLFP